MNQKPDTFEHMLVKYLFRMWVRYGYRLPTSKRRWLVRELPWVDEDTFVEALIRAEGLAPSEKPENFKVMTTTLKEMVRSFEPRSETL